MGFGNRVVMMLLRSPLHGVLSGSTDVVRYTGRRSGRVIATPTQYVAEGDGLVILVGRPESKRWWRNFREERPVEVLVRGRWRPMQARAVVGADEPDEAARLLALYLARFPRAAKALAGGTPSAQAAAAVLVRCRPRAAQP